MATSTRIHLVAEPVGFDFWVQLASGPVRRALPYSVILAPIDPSDPETAWGATFTGGSVRVVMDPLGQTVRTTWFSTLAGGAIGTLTEQLDPSSAVTATYLAGLRERMDRSGILAQGSEGPSFFTVISSALTQSGSLIYGGSADDTVIGGTRADSIYGNGGFDSLSGAGGSDLIYGGDGDDEIFGGAGADTLSGDEVQDTLHGGAGNDVLYGGDGLDVLYGGDGTDRLFGGEGMDYLVGGAGDDFLYGGPGSDRAGYETATVDIVGNLRTNVVLGEGRDRLFDIEGINTGAGNDRLVGNELANFFDGGAGTDTIFGHGGDDTLVGGAGDDILYGGAGDDLLFVYTGRDTVYGGDGHDQINFEYALTGLTIQTSTGRATGGGFGVNRFFGIEDILGGAGNDTIHVGAEQSWHINGFWGDDVILVAGGSHVLNGGPGADRFVFAMGAGGQAHQTHTLLETADEDSLDLRLADMTGQAVIVGYEVFAEGPFQWRHVLSDDQGNTLTLHTRDVFQALTGAGIPPPDIL